MTPLEVETYYGSKAEIARVLGCKLPSIYEWFEEGKGVPEGRQYQLQLATKGKLKADKPANRNTDSESAAKARAASPNAITARAALRSKHREGPANDNGRAQ